MQTAIFGAGCFWGVEAAFRKLDGVVSTSVGYSGGTVENPSYRDVCSGQTGHAEVVEVNFEPDKISYDELLTVFWGCHNPTTLNRQGPDIGSQYRSVIFYLDEGQRELAQASKKHLQQSGAYQDAIVTAIEPASRFYIAEDYHQQYLEKQGLAHCSSSCHGR